MKVSIANLFEVIAEVGGGFLVKIAGVEESPRLYLPVSTTGWCSADTERGVPVSAKGARWVRARELKGHSDQRGDISATLGEKGWRVNGWGGLRLSAISKEAPKPETLEKNALALFERNSAEELAAFGCRKLAAMKIAAAEAVITAKARAEKEKLDIAEQEKAAAEAKEWAALLAKEAAEKAAAEAATKKEAEAQALAGLLKISSEELAAMTEKSIRLAMHKLRMAGKL